MTPKARLVDSLPSYDGVPQKPWRQRNLRTGCLRHTTPCPEKRCCYIIALTLSNAGRFLANVNCYRPSVCLSSVCRLFVCNARAPYSIRRLKFSAMFLRRLVLWPSV